MGLLGTMSAIGTALGPSLGGLLIAGLGWRAIFLVNVPLGVRGLGRSLTATCPPTAECRRTERRRASTAVGTVLLALTLAAYTLAMTIGRGSFGALNIALLLAAAVGGRALRARPDQDELAVGPADDVPRTRRSARASR